MLTTTIETKPSPQRVGSIALRDYQERMIVEARSHFSSGVKRLLAVASTGAGKTVFMAAVTKMLLDKNPSASVVIGIHRQSLIKSTLQRLTDAGIDRDDITVIQSSNRPNPDARVYVVMIQTLDGWIDGDHPYLSVLPEKFAMGFLDEAHETAFHAAGQWLMKRCALLMGVTATPERSGNQESLGQFFQASIQSPSHAELVRMGQLRPCVYSRLNFQEDEQQVLSIDEGIAVSDEEDSPSLAKLVCEPEAQERIITLSEAAIAEYASQNKGVRKTIVFAPSQACAKELAKRWGGKLGKGRVGYILSQGCGVVGTSEANREKIVELFELPDSGLDVLISVTAIAVGFDVPIASIAVFLRKIGSRAMWVQSVGRIARLYSDCNYSLVLDFVGNLDTHSPVEELEWDAKTYLALPELKEKGEGLTKLCPQCDKVHAITTRVCRLENGGCGYIFPLKELEEQFLNWDKVQLKTLHTALWVDVGGVPGDRASRWYEAVRDKWIAINENPIVNPKKGDRIFQLRQWAREFEMEIREGNPSFVAPADTISFKVLGGCFQGMPESKLFQFQAMFSGQIYWNMLVLEIGAKEIGFLCSDEYDRKFGKFAEILRARQLREQKLCKRAIQWFDPQGQLAVMC